MEWDTVQLMVYGENLSRISVKFEDERLKILKIYKPENSAYIFINVFFPKDIDEGEYIEYGDKTGLRSVRKRNNR